MKKCIIFCAGGFDSLAEPITKEDLVIAADGGVRHTAALGIAPQIVLGDFDSLGYVPAEAEVFPVEKDDTDAMLAIKKGLSLGCDTFVLYGSLDGDRLEHTVANFQALQYLQDHGAKGTLVGLRQIVTLIQRERICFPARFEGDVSVFCMGSDARGVTIENLHYNVQNVTLTAGFPLGVSNHFVGKAAAVSVQEGSLLLIWERKNGLPNEK
jgi:thiamine pyrophosphokinase